MPGAIHATTGAAWCRSTTACCTPAPAHPPQEYYSGIRTQCSLVQRHHDGLVSLYNHAHSHGMKVHLTAGWVWNWRNTMAK